MTGIHFLIRTPSGTSFGAVKKFGYYSAKEKRNKNSKNFIFFVCFFLKNFLVNGGMGNE